MNGPVICGIEGVSDESVAQVARDLAERYDVPLFFVHVSHGAAAERESASVRDAAAPGKDEVLIESGHPADRLVEVARDREASFLVVGNHGPRSSLLGSISADVSRRAPCPVVVVPRAVGESDTATRRPTSAARTPVGPSSASAPYMAVRRVS